MKLLFRNEHYLQFSFAHFVHDASNKYRWMILSYRERKRQTQKIWRVASVLIYVSQTKSQRRQPNSKRYERDKSTNDTVIGRGPRTTFKTSSCTSESCVADRLEIPLINSAKTRPKRLTVEKYFARKRQTATNHCSVHTSKKTCERFDLWSVDAAMLHWQISA